MGMLNNMKKIEFNCANNETTIVELNPQEESAVQERKDKLVEHKKEKSKAEQDSIQKRTDAINVVLNSAEISVNPDLKAALAHLLGS